MLRIAPMLSALLVSAASLSAQGVEVEVPCDWKVGDSYRIEIIKWREEWKDGRKTSPGGRGVTPVNATVLKKDKMGYVIRWKFGKARVKAPVKVSAAVQALANLNENLVLMIRTDTYGVPVSLENREDVLKFARGIPGFLRKSLLEGKLPEAQAEALMRSMKATMTPTFLLAKVRESADGYYGYSGATYEVGKRVVTNTQLPLPIGQTVPATIEHLTRSHDKEKGEIRFAMTIVPDPKAMAAVVKKILRDMTNAAGGGKTPDEESFKFDIRIAATATCSTKSGLVLEMEQRKELTSGPMRRIDYQGYRFVKWLEPRK